MIGGGLGLLASFASEQESSLQPHTFHERIQNSYMMPALSPV